MSNTVEAVRRMLLSSVAALVFATIAVCTAAPVVPIA